MGYSEGKQEETDSLGKEREPAGGEERTRTPGGHWGRGTNENSYDALLYEDAMMKPIKLCAALTFYFKKLLGSQKPNQACNI